MSDDFRVLLYRPQDSVGKDITENLKIMYDAIVGSMDWGSGFLSTEEAKAIQYVGELCGFETDIYEREVCTECGHEYGVHQNSTYHPVTYWCLHGRTYDKPEPMCKCTGFKRGSISS